MQKHFMLKLHKARKDCILYIATEEILNSAAFLQFGALQSLGRLANDYVTLRRQLQSRKGLHKALCNQVTVAREGGGVSWQEVGAGALNSASNGNDEDGDEDDENKEKEDKDPSCVQVVRDKYGKYKELLANKTLSTGMF